MNLDFFPPPTFPESFPEPLIVPESFGLAWRDLKDPCPVKAGRQWYLFGSAGSSNQEKWQVFRASASAPQGPWGSCDAVKLAGVCGPHVAAPGVVYDAMGGLFHMFIQTEFAKIGGSIEHLASRDGLNFVRQASVVPPARFGDHACVYDPHPAEIGKAKYLTYSAGHQAGQCDIYALKSLSGSWFGPWEKLGPILRHSQVSHHNQIGQPNYEWGLEGSQLVELPGGRVLLNAVCFLPQGNFGTRQRVFFALAERVEDEFRSLGPVIDPKLGPDWQAGENGHAAAVVDGGKLLLFFQGRSAVLSPWRYGLAAIDLEVVGQFPKLRQAAPGALRA